MPAVHIYFQFLLARLLLHRLSLRRLLVESANPRLHASLPWLSVIRHSWYFAQLVCSGIIVQVAHPTVPQLIWVYLRERFHPGSYILQLSPSSRHPVLSINVSRLLATFSQRAILDNYLCALLTGEPRDDPRTRGLAAISLGLDRAGFSNRFVKNMDKSKPK